MFLAGDECDDLDVRRQPVIGQRHAKFMLEIRENPQAAYYHLGFYGPAKFNSQTAVACDGDLGIIRKSLADERQPVFGGEK